MERFDDRKLLFSNYSYKIIYISIYERKIHNNSVYINKLVLLYYQTKFLYLYFKLQGTCPTSPILNLYFRVSTSNLYFY